MIWTGLLAIVVLALALSRGFHDRTTSDLFFTLTLASTAIVFLHVRPLREVPQLLVATGVLVLLQAFALRVTFSVMPGLAMLGVGSLALLAYRRVWSVGEERSLMHYAFLLPLLFVLLGYASSSLLEITDRLHPSTFDISLYRFDASLGTQLSFEVGSVVLQSRWLTRIALLFYYALPVPVMLIYAKQLVRWRSAAAAAFLGFFIVGPVGVIFYNLLPACGPIYLFGSKFPFEPFSNQQVKEMLVHPVVISGVRNAFPSLHVAWALLASWYAKGLPKSTRFFVLIFLAGTLLSTLGLGEHYFIDLVVALPFALMIQAGCTLQIPWSDRSRFVPFLSGLFLIMIWIVLLRRSLRIMWVSPLVPWTLIALTVLPCLILQPWLGTRSHEAVVPESDPANRNLQ